LCSGSNFYAMGAEQEVGNHASVQGRDMIADVGETAAVAELMLRVRAGDVRALARAISLVEDGAVEATGILAACEASRGKALRVGITGPPGAGKSTLVDQMARLLRAKGSSVGIVAVDPTSPYTGGALLGDRIRMQGFVGDDGVYIRSLASRGAKGGLAAAAGGVCAVMEAAGREMLLIETMGVGQDEIEVARLADVVVLVLVPGMGDDVQSLKAGIMEAADVYVVNKADREGAERVRSEILAMQEIGGGKAPVVMTVATSGAGVGELLEAVDSFRDDPTLRQMPRRTGHLDILGDRSLRLDHIGIAVKSVAGARGFYEAMGMVVGDEQEVEHEQVRTAMLAVGESRLELLEAAGEQATVEESTIGRFIAKRGEGLHHIAIHADDLDGKFAAMKRNGVRLVSDEIKIGAGGHRYFFVHPASTGGVLVEVVGA
jgi:LAO/AO transport system kinase